MRASNAQTPVLFFLTATWFRALLRLSRYSLPPTVSAARRRARECVEVKRSQLTGKEADFSTDLSLIADVKDKRSPCAGNWHRSLQIPTAMQTGHIFHIKFSHTHTHRDSCTNTWLQEVSHLRSGYRSGSLHVQVIKTTVFGDINTCKTHHMCESD